MLKRILSVLLLAALVCSFAACGGETGEPVSSNTPTDSVSSDTDALIDDKSKAESEAENTESTSESNDNVEESDTDDKIGGYLKPPQGVEVIYGDVVPALTNEASVYEPNITYGWKTIFKAVETYGEDSMYCVWIQPDCREFYDYKLNYKINHVSAQEQKESYACMQEMEAELFEKFGIDAQLVWTNLSDSLARSPDYAKAVTSFGNMEWLAKEMEKYPDNPESEFFDYGYIAYVKGAVLMDYLNNKTHVTGALPTGGKIALIPEGYTVYEFYAAMLLAECGWDVVFSLHKTGW
ncbi:MAG: hypothetical protein IKK83_02540 [Clostridia bacterium]|nr:hypothetical protein [Clostridia bacterium]